MCHEEVVEDFQHGRGRAVDAAISLAAATRLRLRHVRSSTRCVHQASHAAAASLGSTTVVELRLDDEGRPGDGVDRR